MRAESLLTAIENSGLTYQRLEADGKVSCRSGGDTRCASAKIRMDRDSAIWLSVSFIGVPVARALVTKDSLLFYERLNRSYVKRDLKSITAFLGADLSLEDLAAIFTGKPIIAGDTSRYTLRDEGGQYQLAYDSKDDPNAALKGLVSRIWVDANGTLVAQSLYKAAARSGIRVGYSGCIRVKDKCFPKRIHIRSAGGAKPILIEIEYKSIRVDQPIRMPFHIPKGYKRIVLW